MNLKLLAAAAALCMSPSFAIIGLGFHYSPNFGAKMDATGYEKVNLNLPTSVANPLTGESVDIPAGDVLYKHGSFSNMQGFGLKLWIDFLPIIDIEATYNIQWGSYTSTLMVNGNEQDIELEFDGVPFGKATPKFVAMNGDLSITYPFTSLPIIRPYIGGGLTYYISTPVMTAQFIEKYLGKLDAETTAAILAGDKEKTKEFANDLSKQLQKDGLNTSIGGHILVGVRAKLPLIPIAAYVNGKYYFGLDYDSAVKSKMFGINNTSLALEAGVGLAI